MQEFQEARLSPAGGPGRTTPLRRIIFCVCEPVYNHSFMDSLSQHNYVGVGVEMESLHIALL
jgi:hypothetical protein